MKTIVFADKISVESATYLLNEISENSNDEIWIYFSGCENNTLSENVILDFLNKINNLNGRIELIAFDTLAGSAFNIFFKYHGTKSVLDTTVGIISLPNDPVAVRQTRKKDRFKYTILKRENDQYLKWLYDNFEFTDYEGRKLRKGLPVSLDAFRVKQMMYNENDI